MKNNNETTWRVIKIALVIAGVLLAIGAFRQRVESNTAQIEENGEQIDTNTEAIIRMEIDTAYIKKGIDEIKVEQKAILKELRE